MKANNSKKIAFRVTEALEKEILKEVAKEGTTTSKWLVTLIEDFMKRKAKTVAVSNTKKKPPEAADDNSNWLLFLTLFLIISLLFSKAIKSVRNL